MNTPTLTPRTDVATYPADCLGKTLVTNRDLACTLERELAALTAERDQLRVDRYYNGKCINRLASATGTLGEKSEKVVEVALSTIDQLRARAERAEASLHAMRLVCGTTDADKFTTWVDRANARAEKAEAAETVALSKWNGALERAMKAEAQLAAEREKSERYRLATLKLDAELATERAVGFRHDSAHRRR